MPPSLFVCPGRNHPSIQHLPSPRPWKERERECAIIPLCARWTSPTRRSCIAHIHIISIQRSHSSITRSSFDEFVLMNYWLFSMVWYSLDSICAGTVQYAWVSGLVGLESRPDERMMGILIWICIEKRSECVGRHIISLSLSQNEGRLVLVHA